MDLAPWHHREGIGERFEGLGRRRSVSSPVLEFANVRLSGDCVQWFRAEAEMQRWQEEWERKQAEFMRCIRSFGKMSDVWAELSKSSPSNGHASYAQKKSAMFARMRRVAQAKFDSAGYASCTLDEGQILADLIKEDRCKLDGPKLSDLISR
jgi:hypothetical protein